jgi:hypothetical protein
MPFVPASRFVDRDGNLTPDARLFLLSLLTSGSGVTDVTASAPLTSSGGATPDIALANSGVVAGTYGDGTHVPQVTVSAKGHVSSVVDVAITDTGITELTNDVTAGPGNGSQVATIANDAVTNAKLANVSTATLKGRTTAGSGDPEDLTGTQATALLDVLVGDSGAGGTKGLAPAPAAGDAAAGKFLKADGTYAVPSGGTTVEFSPLTDGDLTEPELIFYLGDVIMVAA